MAKESKNTRSDKSDSRSDNRSDNNRENLPGRQRDSAPDILSRLLDDDLLLEPLNFFRTPRLASRLGRQSSPRVDVSETDNEVRVTVELPGVDPDNIEIYVQDNRMRISGSVEREITSGERPYRYERSYGEFRREFMLPARVREDEVRAVYRDGVLTVTLPKAEGQQRKNVSIERQ